MAIRGILFDNDGTLVDTYDLILASFRHATETVLGKQFAERELMRGVGTPLDDQMRTLADEPRLQQELSRVYREHNHAVHDEAVTVFPGVLDGLSRLDAAGFALGVVTAKRHALAQRGLEIVGAAPYLRCLVGADDCAINKPDPAPIVLGAELLGLPAAECLYVGDSPFDIQAGNAAGCATVAVLWGMFDAEELHAENPTYEVATFAELEALAFELGACPSS